MMDAPGLQHHIGKAREAPLVHVVIPLMGIFKGKLGAEIIIRLSSMTPLQR